MFVVTRKSSTLVGMGVGLLAGLLLASAWPHTPLHAVATDRHDTFAIATGYCDEQIEAIWFLDFLTGELRAAAVSKQAGVFNAFFARNIAADLGVDISKSPRFLMTTGYADLRHAGGARVAPSRSLLYVAEVTTGRVAAYSIPWSAANWVAGQRITGQIVLLDVTRFRAGFGATTASTKE